MRGGKLWSEGEFSSVAPRGGTVSSDSKGQDNNSCLQLLSTACVSSTSYLPAPLDLFGILGSGCCSHTHCTEAETEAEGLCSLDSEVGARTGTLAVGTSQGTTRWVPGRVELEASGIERWRWRQCVCLLCSSEVAGVNAGRMEDPMAGKNGQA